MYSCPFPFEYELVAKHVSKLVAAPSHFASDRICCLQIMRCASCAGATEEQLAELNNEELKEIRDTELSTLVPSGSLAEIVDIDVLGQRIGNAEGNTF